MHDSESDLELLQQYSCSGNADSLCRFLERHIPRLRRLIEYRMDPRLSRRISPSDVIQDTTVELTTTLKRFLDDPRIPPFLWLRFLATRKLHELSRKHLLVDARAITREVHLDQITTINGLLQSQANFFDRNDTPSAAMAKDERARLVHEALQKLEPIDREILVLRHFECLDNLEAATLLGLRTNTATVRYFRAMERLRRRLEGIID